ELLTVGGDATVRHWGLPEWSTGRQEFLAWAVSPPLSRSVDGEGWVVLANGNVVRWVPQRRRLQMEWNGTLETDPATALAAGRADGKVVLATERGRALVLDMKTGKPVVEFKGPDNTRKPRDLPAGWQRLPGGPQTAVRPPLEAVAVQSQGPRAAS